MYAGIDDSNRYAPQICVKDRSLPTSDQSHSALGEMRDATMMLVNIRFATESFFVEFLVDET